MSPQPEHCPPHSPSSVTVPELVELEKAGVHSIRLTWVDLANIIRYEVFPLSQFESILQAKPPGAPVTRAAPTLCFNTPAIPFSQVGAWLYAPDMTTLKRLPYAPGYASVMGCFTGRGSTGSLQDVFHRATGLDPRALLYEAVDDAFKKADTRFSIGFESTFVLLRQTPDGSIQPVTTQPWTAARALLSGTPEADVLNEIVQSLKESGIVVEKYHKSGAQGQYTIVTGPLSPLQAADVLIHTRETIVNVANKHRLRATFAPRVFTAASDWGSGCLARIFVHRSNTNSNEELVATSASKDCEGCSLTRREASFLAGLLEHLRGLECITLPTPQSYERVRDNVWGCGSWVSYGSYNPETPISLRDGPDGQVFFELRILDGTANPYVALAAVLRMGAVAIADQRKLDMRGCDERPPSDGEQRTKAGVTTLLARSTGEARAWFNADAQLIASLGEIGKVWNTVSLAIEASLAAEVGKFGSNYVRIMTELY